MTGDRPNNNKQQNLKQLKKNYYEKGHIYTHNR